MQSKTVSLLSNIMPRYWKESTIGIGVSLIKIGMVLESDLSLEAIIIALHFEKFVC